eukprot:Gregarina_sp_Poly_1__131@NODE_102_length_14381_cov_59_883820_g89_i0_p2_GENE_NODE_102_length_14381_cov_59_883820_g89_i0NODE_102_length_14381_cov_59_883820_g89_i0_p2_ORF_typecomplete_len572_score50_96Adap_comp_sub/PF00928_21/3_3e37_NODE_102_length_14381_cov_59_883820_g89_i044336148
MLCASLNGSLLSSTCEDAGVHTNSITSAMIDGVVLLGPRGELLGRKAFENAATRCIPCRTPQVNFLEVLTQRSQDIYKKLKSANGLYDVREPLWPDYSPIDSADTKARCLYGVLKGDLCYCVCSSTSAGLLVMEIIDDLHNNICGMRGQQFSSSLLGPSTGKTGSLISSGESVWLLSVILELAFTSQGYPSVMDGELLRSLLPNADWSPVGHLVASLGDKRLANALDSVLPLQGNRGAGPKAYELLGRGSGTGAGGGGLLNTGSDTWWRRNKIGYGQDELLIDLREGIQCVIDRFDRLVCCCVSGEIIIQSRLSGLPECRIGLEGADKIDSIGCSHFCTRIDGRFNCRPLDNVEAGTQQHRRTSSLISFIPPDGVSVLLNFIVAPQICVWRPPVTLKASWTFTENKGHIEIAALATNTSNFSCRLPSDVSSDGPPSPRRWILEDVVLTLPLSPGIPNVSVCASHGKAVYDRDCVRWRIGTFTQHVTNCMLEVSMEWGLQALETAKEDSQVFSEAERNRLITSRLRGSLSFSCRRWNLSGVRVALVEINRTKKNFFKGCRHAVEATNIEYQF